MSVETAQAIAGAFAGYLVLGLAFALAFVTRGVAVIDPAARGMPRLARLLIVPGAAALWPLMLWKWCTQKSPPVS
jgi:uncharacterized membrane protein YphA (DoxX/SURF4 family)